MTMATAASSSSSAEASSSAPTSPLLTLLSDPSSSTLIKQGAEAKVYKSYPTGRPSSSSSSSSPWLLKYRFPKTYRHPHLSQTITTQRTVSEARALVRCARYGVEVPVVELVDEKEGILVLEWIEGSSVREWLGGGAEEGDEVGASVEETNAQQVVEAEEEEEEEGVDLTPAEQLQLMTTIGHQLALMHAADVIHGDLTTSNLMVRTPSSPSPGFPTTSFRVVIIDFGLSFTSSLIEDKAVDLYVLERAFLSTHPHSAHLFDRVLKSYGERIGELWRMGCWRRGIGGTADEGSGKKGKKGGKGKTTGAANGEADKAVATVTSRGDAALDELVEATRKAVIATTPAGTGDDPWRDIRRRLDEVRMRGRKRSMVG